jgi:phosphate-selective porin OprO/OprP
MGRIERWAGLRSGERIRLRGRIDTDWVSTFQDERNEQTYGAIEDSAGLRRARVGIEGRFTEESRYLAEIDLASGNVVIRDLFVGQGRVSDGGEVRVGHFREPFSLEGATSANSFAFLERSGINQLDPARNWGAGYFVCDPEQTVTLGAGIFQSGTDSSDLRGGPGTETALTAKVTALPWADHEHARWMHVGGALSTRLPNDGVVLVDQGPNSPLVSLGDSTTSPFVQNLRIPARLQQLFNAQWALANGPFSIQIEWYGSWIDGDGISPVFLHGSYIQGGYFLTGESREYNASSGTLDGVKVARPFLPGISPGKHHAPRGPGAWELTARFGYLDFFDGDIPPAATGAQAGVQIPQTTLGLNWYLADRMRVLLNYSVFMPDDSNTETSVVHTVGMRLGVFW